MPETEKPLDLSAPEVDGEAADAWLDEGVDATVDDPTDGWPSFPESVPSPAPAPVPAQVPVADPEQTQVTPPPTNTLADPPLLTNLHPITTDSDLVSPLTSAPENTATDTPTSKPTPEDLEATDTYSPELASPQFSGTKPGHFSTMSFTRTAQEMPLSDDEDTPEWDLQRKNTDLFKFMPPNERSNSFPVVPPATAHKRQAESVSQLPDPAEFLGVAQTADDDFDTPHAAHEALNNVGFDSADVDAEGWDEDVVPASGPVAGDSATSRFEEGMPLMGSEEVTTPAVEKRVEDVLGGLDDVKPLQRKSTMQVIGGGDGAVDVGGLDVMQEEEEDDEVLPQRQNEDLESEEPILEESVPEENAPVAIPEPAPEPTLEAAPEPVAEATLQPTPEPILEQTPQEPTPQPEFAAEPQPAAPEPSNEIISEAVPAVEPTPEAVAEVPSEFIPETVPETSPESAQDTVPEMAPSVVEPPATSKTHSHGRTPSAIFFDNFANNTPATDDDFFNQVSQPPSDNQSMTIPMLTRQPPTPSVLPGEAPSATAFGGPSPVAEEEAPKDVVEAKWEEAFADEDDDLEFLDDVTPAEPAAPAKPTAPVDSAVPVVDVDGFLSSDDDSLLDDDEDLATTAAPVPIATTPAAPVNAPAANQFASASLPSPNPFMPASQFQVPPSPYGAPPTATPYGSMAPPPKPELKKVDSFVNKAKQGYQSPYDLPMDLKPVQPRKRPTMQAAMPPATAGFGPPPPVSTPGGALPIRSNSFGPQYATGPAPGSRDSSSVAPPPMTGAARPALKSPASGFFEDLPMNPKPRAASRAPSVRASSPAPGSGFFPSQPSGLAQSAPAPPPASNPYAPVPAPVTAPMTTPNVPPSSSGVPMQPQLNRAPSHGLVSPGPVNPYAPAPQAQAQAVPATNRFAPPPVSTAGGGNRYSPAPVGSRPSSSYAAGPVPPPLPHQPRTSSPLAHFEITGGDGGERRASHFSNKTTSHAGDSVMSPASPPQKIVGHDLHGRYAPGPPSNARSTPPPPTQSHVPRPPSAHTTLSPPKRTNANYGNVAPVSPRRPSSSHYGAPGVAPSLGAPSQYSQPLQPKPPTRPRAPSIKVNMVPPTDGRELDPLERWKGSPIITWSPSGSIVTSFPKSVPRYSAGSSVPTVMRMTGEVKVQHVKDMVPLDERLALFPGPLKGKGKKKEVIAWLMTGIEMLEKEVSSIPESAIDAGWSFEQHRAAERVLLWKVLQLLVEHDGRLDGSPAVEKAVQNILSPDLADRKVLEDAADMDNVAGAGVTPFMMGANTLGGIPGGNGSVSAGSGAVMADAVDSAVIERIKSFLAVGNGEKAVWAAADKRLWGHAMLIANTVSPELYRQVSQEFIRKEVNFPGHKNESLAALYAVMAGNADECVDELVPSHARAGLQLIAAAPGMSAGSESAAGGLNKWRETLALILSNKSRDEDLRALVSLGGLLADYGRIEAAHVCFLFSRGLAVFGGLDDPRANFVLVGADHQRHSAQFAHEPESLLLSEIFEYALSLNTANGSFNGGVVPHLSAYKLQLAMVLAEYGQRDKSMAYCDAIMASLSAQTRRSPYHHGILENAVDDLQKRLRSAPREESNSWMTKPSMNKVSNSIWSTFNTFVSGDDRDNETNGSGSDAGVDGPFGRIPPGGTPTISRSPSVANFENAGMGMNMGPNLGAANSSFGGPQMTLGPVPGTSTRPSSRYAPSPMLGAAVPAGNPYAPISLPPVSQSANPYAAVPSGSSDYPAPSSSYAPSLPGASSDYGNSRVASYDSSPVPPGSANPYASMGGPVPSSLPAADNMLKSPISMTSHNSFVSVNNFSPPGTSSAPPPQVTYGGFEPPSMTPEVDSEDKTSAGTDDASKPSEHESGASSAPPGEVSYGGFEPPSFQPYTPYEPEPDSDEDGEKKEKPKKKSFMDDDEDDIPGLGRAATIKEGTTPGTPTAVPSEREPDDLVRKIAEEEAKRDAEEKAAKAKKGWFGGWFGGKEQGTPGSPEPRKATRANLGEQSSFVFDPVKQKWVNKAAGAGEEEVKKPRPPPPRAVSSSGGSPGGPPMPPARTGSVPPMGAGGPGGLLRSNSMASLAGPSGSRPGTSMSNASSLDDLLSVQPRAKGNKAKKKGGARYAPVPGI